MWCLVGNPKTFSGVVAHFVVGIAKTKLSCKVARHFARYTRYIVTFCHGVWVSRLNFLELLS